ncbi:YadA-like family protein [bacterium]|nr:YadA-like family protein [bacterium]
MAQLLVGDIQGNMRGLVVQENKTTLSGAQNEASLTLDTRGATFSNPTTGAPIQVHGVADGNSDFDAVNVRQLYSGLASVMAASTPELRLEPGKSSAAFGVGHYGGYSGVGFGVGHMFDNNTVLTFSAGKAPHSEPAFKASLSWTW